MTTNNNRNGWNKFLVKILWFLVFSVISGMWGLSFWGYCDLNSKLAKSEHNGKVIIKEVKSDIKESICEIKDSIKEIKAKQAVINADQVTMKLDFAKSQTEIKILLEQIKKKMNED